MIEGSCHCGNVTFSVAEEPRWLTSCNCSICRRIAALWAYFERHQVTINAADDATIDYVQGDKTLAMHTCRRCGCTTHWTSVDVDKHARMGVNFRMCPDADVARFRVRHLDGAHSWQFLD